jgi:hypothetical protein
MRKDLERPTRPIRRRVGLAALATGGLLVLGGCHGHGHYSYHGGHHGYSSHCGQGHGYTGDADIFAALAVLFFGLWAWSS